MIDKSQRFAELKLADQLNKSLVPGKDFVLYIKEENSDIPIAISANSGEHQAICIHLLPDFVPKKVRLRQR